MLDGLIEYNHLALQNAREAQGSNVFTLVGHISGVDPTTNRIKVVIPSWTNDNMTYMESGWIPLGTPVAGNQYGIQLLPFGQATVTDPLATKNPQNGNTPMTEQVLVHVLGRKRGLYVQSVQMFNQVDVPPTGYQDLSGVQAAPGEWLLKHSTGNYLYFSNDNSVKLQALTNPAPVVQTDQTPDSVTQNLLLGAQAVGQNTNKNGDTVTGATSNVTIISDASGGSSTTDSNINVTAQQTDAEDSSRNTSSITLEAVVTNGLIGQANLDLKANSEGADTDNAQFTVEAKSQSVGTSQGTINIDAGELGTGTLDINVKGLASTMNILLDGTTNLMTITVTDGILNVICAEANVTAETSATVESPLVNVDSAHITLGSGASSNLLNQFSALVYNVHTHVAPDGITSGPSELIEPASSCQNVFGS